MSRFASKQFKPLAPASALDLALEGLAKGQPEASLRRAVPALGDSDTAAPAADVCGRALVALGETALAKRALERAVDLLIEKTLVPHAVAAASTLKELDPESDAMKRVARAFGAGSPVGGAVKPPSLAHSKLEPLAATLTGAALIDATRAAIDALPTPKAPGAHPRYPLWSALPEDAFVRFSEALKVRVVPELDALVREGEPGESAFILARGEVRVSRVVGEESEELAALGPGSIVGEMALVTDAPRAASVLAAHAVLVLEAPRAALDQAAAEVPALGAQIVTFFHKRLVDNTVRTSPLLSGLPANERDGFAQLFETRAFDAGAVVIAEGDETPGLFLIAAGQFAITRSDGAESLRIATLGPGMCVGEIGMVLRRPATASVIAETSGVTLCLPKERFMQIVRERPTLFAQLYELAVQRDDETRSVLAVPAEDIEEVLL
ncbi:MAG: cyclic nucleotide-binding domain-containing protein [Myxococcales bacterium]|nr:cyclic nucleotide-binding domain-containing protein [Myxococcales bacterium]